MSYIGQQLPADTFSGFVTDSFTGDGSATTFTLSKAPFSEDALIVVINNVIQKPVTNFTVSGTTLTIVGTAVASGDVIYAMHTSGAVPSTLASKVDVNGLSDGIILDADADTTISADTDDQIDFKAGGTDVMSLTASALSVTGTAEFTTTGNVNNFRIVSTDAGSSTAPDIVFVKDSASPADGDFLGRVDFRGDDSAGNETNYISLFARANVVTNGSEQGALTFADGDSGNSLLHIQNTEITINQDSIDMDFRIESNNYTRMFSLDAGNDRIGIGNNSSAPGHTLDVRDAQNDVIFRLQNTLTSGNIYGQYINFSYAPDDNSNHFFYCADTVANRMFIYSDGDIKNHDNSYGQVSDERIKQNIKDANSQWDDIKALKVRNFERKDDVAAYGEGKKVQIGLIAQECEAVSPGLVKESEPMAEDIKMSSEFGTLNEDGTIKTTTGEKVKGISYSVLYMKAIKALQEAMAKIETLETKVKALEDA